MFESKTIFVVGAGAGVEIGMPTGTTLRDAIRRKLKIEQDTIGQYSGDQSIRSDFLDASNMFRIGFDELVKAGLRIRQGLLLENSIDDFLDVHREDRSIQLSGKIAIVRLILEAEAASPLFHDPRSATLPYLNGPRWEKFGNTWYRQFMALLHNGIDHANLAKIFENITFVIFNYDRCIEQFLFWALQATYGISEQGALEFVTNNLKVFHPYGVVGNINSFGNGDAVSLASGIRTYTEEVQKGAELNELRAAIANAEVVVFIGFGFHKQNMALLTPSHETKIKRVFATADGISEYDIPIVRQRIREAVRSPSFSPPSDKNTMLTLGHLEK